MSDKIDMFEQWKESNMENPRRMPDVVEQTWELDEPRDIPLAEMNERLAAAGATDPTHMLIEKVTVEVTSMGGGPIGVALTVRGNSHEDRGVVFTVPDLAVARSDSFEDATFVTHTNQYKEYDVAKVSRLERDFLRERALEDLGVDWKNGVLHVSSPVATACCLLTLRLHFLYQVEPVESKIHL